MLKLNEAWIKAAVEHRILEIVYYSGETKKEVTKREVEPDFMGISRDGKSIGLWATYCHLRHEGPRCFKQETVMRWNATDKTFQPSARGRWKELVPEYERLGLSSKQF